ncbi:hypothetical protein CQA20_29505, partial [Klebsiella pneumoniae]
FQMASRAYAGRFIIGSTVKMAYVDQSRDSLSDDKTVWEDISGGLDIINIGKFQMASRAYAGRFIIGSTVKMAYVDQSRDSLSD